MAKAKGKVKVTPKKKASGGEKNIPLSAPRMNIHIKIDANGEQRKKGW